MAATTPRRSSQLASRRTSPCASSRRTSRVSRLGSDGSASAGTDYADRGTLVEKFAAGEQNRTLRVPIIGGAVKEADETLYVHFAPNDEAGAPIKAEEQKIEVVVKDDD